MQSSPVPAEVPLYTVRCYNDVLYRVTKRLFTPSPCRTVDREDFQEYDKKLDCALSRSRSAIREYALCNDWEYFFTFTLDPSKWDRYSLQSFLKEFLQWLQNLRKAKYPHLRYLLVPEPHWDGAWHFHGLISGIDVSPLPSWAPRDLLDGGYYEWTEYRLRYGWCSLAPVKDAVAVGFYVAKYITKSSSGLAAEKGVHTHYQSQGLNRALPVGYVYRPDLYLDGLCTHSNAFYASGFFKMDDVGNVVGLCDEVSEMYQSFVFEDPITHEVVGVVGGDSNDESVQLAIQQFFDFGAVPLPWDLSDQSCCVGGGSPGAGRR